MEITIKRYSRKLTYEDAATLDEFWELAKRTERSLDREQRRHWDGRECDEYIIAAQGVLPYCATPEELVCQRETLDEILAVLALCTPTQRERFLLYALYDFSYAEIGRMCSCSKAAVYGAGGAVDDLRDSLVVERQIMALAQRLPPRAANFE